MPAASYLRHVNFVD